MELAEEERPVAPLEADLVVVDDGGRRGPRHHSLPAARRCLGRRRYTVFGISTFGGLAGIGLRIFAWIGFGRFTGTVYPGGPAQ